MSIRLFIFVDSMERYGIDKNCLLIAWY